MARLGVNIDHVATVRQARRVPEPDPVHAAVLAELGGAHGITVHLRADRRHIQDRDVEILRQTVKTRLNVEMAATQEMLRIALTVKPDQVTLVPERREEVTTEGGLDVVLNSVQLKPVVRTLQEGGIQVSLFVDPDLEQVKESHKLDAQAVEINTAAYADARDERSREAALRRVVDAARLGKRLGMQVHAGHGLTYRNVLAIAAVSEIGDLNIGHSIVARAVLVGMERAVREMLDAMERGSILAATWNLGQAGSTGRGPFRAGSDPMIEAYGQTDVGRRRKLNEDNFLVDTETNLFSVCDGMGGHNAGEVASKMAIETLGAFIRKSHKEKEITWPYGLDVNLSFDGNRLKTALKLSNKKVFKAADNREDYTGMGTTAVGALVSGNLLTVGSAGDSRCYVFSAGKLIQITRDDSWVSAAWAEGILSADEIEKHPLRNVITKAIGAKEDIEINVVEHKLLPGDVAMVCSDGLHSMINDEAILAAVTPFPASLEEAAAKLIEAANEAGGKDNVSVVLLRYTE